MGENVIGGLSEYFFMKCLWVSQLKLYITYHIKPAIHPSGVTRFFNKSPDHLIECHTHTILLGFRLRIQTLS